MARLSAAFLAAAAAMAASTTVAGSWPSFAQRAVFAPGNRSLQADATGSSAAGFGAFMLRFGRRYSGAAEERERAGIFAANVALMSKHNAEADRGINGYRMGTA